MLTVAPLPNCLLLSFPQHFMEASSRMAQVWACPFSSATAVRPVPRLLVSVGEFCSVVPPSPSWPTTPSPQHETEPLSSMAQVCLAPPEIATAVRPVPRLLVSVGEFCCDVPPLPKRPPIPNPQQETEPLSRMAQVCFSPTEIATAVRPVPRLLVSVG